jgi:hypothetical protein
MATRCGHTFHDDCFTEWLQTESTCPVCRGNVTEWAGRPVEERRQRADTSEDREISFRLTHDDLLEAISAGDRARATQIIDVLIEAADRVEDNDEAAVPVSSLLNIPNGRQS